jgi:hypothetical protein
MGTAGLVGIGIRVGSGCQNQLAVARDAQAVLTPGMFNDQLIVVAKKYLALQASWCAILTGRTRDR